MRLPLLTLIPTLTSALPLSSSSYPIPSPRDSAILARRVLHLTPTGVLSTVFPSSPSRYTPSDLSSQAIGLSDYISDCPIPSANSSSTSRNDPTFLALSIATTFRNVAAGSNISLSIQWDPPAKGKQWVAALPRFALFGYLEDVETGNEEGIGELEVCFAEKHPDAQAWYPGNPIHESRWVRLVVREVYWIGGFGDRAYIGWIKRELWQGVKEKEWRAVRLPGEEAEDEGKVGL